MFLPEPDNRELVVIKLYGAAGVSRYIWLPGYKNFHNSDKDISAFQCFNEKFHNSDVYVGKDTKVSRYLWLGAIYHSKIKHNTIQDFENLENYAPFLLVICYSTFCKRDMLQNKSSLEKEKIGWHRNSGEWQWDKSNKGFPLSHWLPRHILLLYRHNNNILYPFAESS